MKRPGRAGFAYGRVQGLSMFPALLPGDLVRAVRRSGNSLAPGQVVVLEEDLGPFLHRFVRYVRPRGLGALLLTAGDGSGPDDPRPVPERVLVAVEVLRRGRWRRIPPRRWPPARAVPSFLLGPASRLLGWLFR
jgi:hypothetical protein